MDYKRLYDNVIQAYQNSDKRIFLISIGGCSRSGKTTLAKKLREDLEKKNIVSLLISLDNWIIGIDERNSGETVRERFRYKKIVESFTLILNGEKIYPPIYDPKTRLIINQKNSEGLYLEKGICIADGVIVLDIKKLRELSNLKIFVEINDNLRLERLKEFYIDYKKCSIDETKKIILNRELEEVPIIKSSKKFADIIYFSR